MGVTGNQLPEEAQAPLYELADKVEDEKAHRITSTSSYSAHVHVTAFISAECLSPTPSALPQPGKMLP